MSASPAPTESVAAVVDWLLGAATRIGDTGDLVAALGERLRSAGLPVDRMTTGVPILHPQVSSSSVIWEPGRPPEERRWILDAETIPMFENSPLRVVYRGGGPVRCRIGPAAEPGEYGILADLRATGFTDYLALPAAFSDGAIKAITAATRAPEGFADADVAALERIARAAAPVLEIQILRRTARTLLDTYIGPIAGRRVLDGAIRRGMGETIRALVWFCDLRGFTALSDSVGRDALIALLNDYFGATTEAVSRHGGEVLKFMGDAMLAIFPLPEDAAADAVARSALAAAREAQGEIAAHNERRAAAGEPLIRCGVALHLGDVLYGNIGGVQRLDFTVIGPAVNLASRLEKLCGELARPILLSAEVAALVRDETEALGEFPFKGLAGTHAVFAPV